LIPFATFFLQQGKADTVEELLSKLMPSRPRKLNYDKVEKEKRWPC